MNEKQSIDWDRVYAGLTPSDWHLLKNGVLSAARGDTQLIEIPESVSDHPAAKLLKEYIRTGKQRLLDQAAKELCPDCPEKAWLVLEKS